MNWSLWLIQYSGQVNFYFLIFFLYQSLALSIDIRILLRSTFRRTRPSRNRIFWDMVFLRKYPEVFPTFIHLYLASWSRNLLFSQDCLFILLQDSEDVFTLLFSWLISCVDLNRVLFRWRFRIIRVWLLICTYPKMIKHWIICWLR